HRRRELISVRVARLGILVDQRSSRIWQAEDLRRLVERLARRVIARLTDYLHIEVVAEEHNLGMATTYCQAQERKPGPRLIDEVRQYMGLHMVHLDKRDAQCEGHSLRERNADQKGAD